MKLCKHAGLLVAAVLLWCATPLWAQQTTAFTYQGQLRDATTNANGAYMMTFGLYDAVSGGVQIGSKLTNNPVLINGVFSVDLDFGTNAFDGKARWLAVTVEGETLVPRVKVMPAPYALFAAVAATVTNQAITSAQLAPNAVATTNIQNSAVTTLKIADRAITNPKLAENAVGTTNIQDGAVTGLKIPNFHVVRSLNGLTDAVVLSAGSNITVTQSGYSLEISAFGQVVKSLNGLTNAVVLSAGSNITLTANGNSLVISAILPPAIPSLGGSVPQGIQIFHEEFSTNTFIVPTNITRIMVEMWGGGGGGGRGGSGSEGATWGGGGGGGGYAIQIFNVVAGQSFAVVPGPGGRLGQAGQASRFGGSMLIAGGGGAGHVGTEFNNGSPGAGGVSVGSIFPPDLSDPGEGTSGGKSFRGGSGGISEPLSTRHEGGFPGGGAAGTYNQYDDPYPELPHTGGEGIIIVTY